MQRRFAAAAERQISINTLMRLLLEMSAKDGLTGNLLDYGPIIGR